MVGVIGRARGVASRFPLAVVPTAVGFWAMLGCSTPPSGAPSAPVSVAAPAPKPEPKPASVLPAASPATTSKPVPEPTNPPAPAAAPAGPTEFHWYTELGDTVVARCDAILIGKVGAISELRGGVVVRVDIETWLDGERADGQTEVTLLAHADDFFTGTELLLFLERFEGGGRFTYLNRILRSDPDFDPKLKLLERTLALRKVARDDDRRREVRRMLFEDSGATDAWTRSHVLRELAYLRKAWPDVLAPEDLADLRDLASRSTDPNWKKALLAALAEKERNQ